jgi:tape measure domain-containing protein
MANDINYTLNLKDLFSKKMGGAVAETAKLDSKLKSTTQRFSDLRKASERMQATKEKQRIDDIIAAKNGTSAFGEMGNAAKIATGLAVAAFGMFGRSVFNNLVEYEYFSTGIRTMMKGDALAGKALEGQLVNLAKTTPFELSEIQSASKRLMAYGVAGGQVVDKLRMLGNVSAGLGKQSLPFLITAFGQIKSKGHLAGQELNQLTEQGFNPLNIIAKKTGKSYDELLKEMAKGQITFKMVDDAFKTVTSSGGQFFNLMDEQSRTVGGKWSNLSDVWNQIQVNIGKSQSGILAGTIGFISSMADKLNNRLAGGNFLDETIKKKGLEQSYKNVKSSFMGGINFGAKAGEYQDIVTSGSGSAKDIAQNLQYFGDILKRNEEKVKSGKMTMDEYRISTALASESIQKLKGGLTLLKTKADTSLLPVSETSNGLTSGNKKTDSLGTGTEVTGNRPQSLTLNITKLIETQNISTTNMSETSAKIKEEVSKALLEAVNDVNTVAR